MISQIMELVEAANVEIQAYFNQYYGDRVFFIVTVMCFVYLFVTCEEIRYKFLLPVALILLVIMNPIVYHYILSKTVYWRLFWMVPNVELMGGAVIVLLNRQKKIWGKWLVLALSIVFVWGCGNNVFQCEIFTKNQNWEKVSQETIDICDMILSQHDKPRVVVPDIIFSEVRQYAPEIEMMYGRDAHWYIKDIGKIASETYGVMHSENPNNDHLLSLCRINNYNFLVVLKDRAIDDELLAKHSYVELGQTDEMIVYYNKFLTEENK